MFSHIAEVAMHSFHQMSVVCKFPKVKTRRDISHTKVPNGVLAHNVTNGKKQMQFGKLGGGLFPVTV
jgi:hypothetical protein